MSPAPGRTRPGALGRVGVALVLGVFVGRAGKTEPTTRVLTAPPVVLPAADCPALGHLPTPAVALGPAGFAASAIPPPAVSAAPAPRVQTGAERAARQAALWRVLDGAR